MKAKYYILLVAAILCSCGTESTPTYQLTAEAEPAEAGTVVFADGPEFQEGESVEITANPRPHWVFTGWRGDASGSGNPLQVAMNADKHITALFEKQQYPLTVLIEGEGTVSRRVVRAKSEHDHGSMVELTAEPAEGWSFIGWRGGISGSSNPRALSILGDTEVTAVFELNEHEVAVEVIGRGEVVQEIIPGKSVYDYGTRIQLTATPRAGWGFLGWSGDISGGENPVEISIDRDYSITASFEEVGYTIETEVKGKGYVSFSPNRDVYRYGQLVTIEAHPDDEWAFHGWSGDITGTRNPERVVIDTQKNIVAEFRKRPAELELYECSTRCGGAFARDRKLPFPYSSGVMAYTSTNANTVTVQRYYLKAIAESFTIIDVSATDTRRITTGRISGLSNGTVIKPGEIVEFSLEAGRTHGRQAGLRYRFKVRETGQTFRYDAALTTN